MTAGDDVAFCERDLRCSSKILFVSVSVSSATKTPLPSFDEARRIVEQYASTIRPTDPELLSLLDAVGLVLAEDLRADRDFPPFPRSTRDGFAVRAADLRKVPAQLRCLGEIKAGVAPEHSAHSNQMRVKQPRS